MSLLARLRARRAHRQFLHLIGLDRRSLQTDAQPKFVASADLRIHLARHLAAAEAATLSVDLDVLARDLGVEILEDPFLEPRSRCEAMIERLRSGVWRLSLAETLSLDNRRLTTALLLTLRVENPEAVHRMCLRARDAWRSVETAPEAHSLALALLAPPRSVRTLARAFPGDLVSQARRLRLSPDLLALALRGHVST